MSPAGAGVLVSRPAHQADGLCRALERAGLSPWRLPAIDIRPAPASDQQQAALAAAADADWWVFVSPNAVEHGLRALAERGVGRRPATRIACVGGGTARALAAAGLPADLVPAGASNSASLLAEPLLQEVHGRRVVVFRGDGGRELLPETLRARGAELYLAEVYRRALPAVDPAPVARALAQGEIQVAVLTSVTALEHLLELLTAAALAETGLVAVSERIIEAARERGLRGPAAVSREPGDEALVEAIVQLVQA